MSQEVSVSLLWDIPQEWNFSTMENNSGESLDFVDIPSVLVGDKRPRDGDFKSNTLNDGAGGGSKDKAEAIGDESRHELHIWTERERRKKIRNMYSGLQSLIPNLSYKADKSTIIEEAVEYIKSLQQNLEKLQKQKMEQPYVILQSSGSRSREAFMADHSRSLSKTDTDQKILVPPVPRFDCSFQTWSSPNVVLNVTGRDAHISICAAKKPHILSTILSVLEKHNLEVVVANISSGHFKIMYMIHTRATTPYPKIFMVEEIFKLAAKELIMRLS